MVNKDKYRLMESNMDNLDEEKIFLEKINGRKDLLEKLSLDRLKILKKHYEKIVEENNQEIERLKKQLED